jgi:polysaccharide biosynthesis transport protein
MRNTEREYEESEGGLDPERIFSAMRRRWRIAAGVAFTTLLLAALIAFLLPNRYEATATVQLDPRKKNVSNVEGVVSDLNADTASIESEAEVIGSRKVLLKVIERLDLRHDPEFNEPGLFDRISGSLSSIIAASSGERSPGTSRSDPTIPHRDEIAHNISKKLTVSRVRNTLLIAIRFSSRDPDKAARIASTIADVYVDEQLQAKSNVAQTATNMLDEQLDALRKKVSDAERKVEAYKTNQNIITSEGQNLSEKELARMMEQTVEARNRTAEARARFERVKELRASGRDAAAIADVLSSHTVRLLKDKLTDATRRQAELATRYGSRHPEMIKVRAELQDARQQLASEIASLVANLENEFEEAAARERELLGSLEQKKHEEAQRRAAMVRLNELEREAETSRQIYQVLLARYKENAATRTLQLPDARIVEYADTPVQPASPKRNQILVLAAAGGLTLGIALVLALEFATPGIGRPEDAEELLDLEHISSLPRLEAMDEEADDPLLATRLMIAAPSSAFAEAIRAMRREIDLRQAEPGPRVILIAGSLPGEGASVVASNLAHAYALSGERVLLVDADMRRSNLTRKLAAQRPAGLAEALAGAVLPEQAILRDQLTNLHFLPATGGALMPSGQPELLASGATPRLLSHLKQQFDTVVIDAPPLLPVIDTRVIADYADQIVFVMAWRRTPKQLARRAMKLLSFNAERITGVVVNQVAADVLADDSGVELIHDHRGHESILAA